MSSYPNLTMHYCDVHPRSRMFYHIFQNLIQQNSEGLKVKDKSVKLVINEINDFKSYMETYGRNPFPTIELNLSETETKKFTGTPLPPALMRFCEDSIPN